jgi:hypothetical protein
MTAALGKHQLCLLATMASPFSFMIISDPRVEVDRDARATRVPQG